MADTWYYIDSGAAPGSWNMALDVALAKTAAKRPFLRFYSWDPYCLSLGYAQKMEEFDIGKCAGQHLDVVRRPTGGRAILHSEELTYSVTLSERHPLFKYSIMEFYRYFSNGLARGLANLGLPVVIEKTGITRDPDGHHPGPLCFSSVGRYELKVRGKKIIGSAQRRFPECLLQHGSILLGDYHLRQEALLRDSLKPKGPLLGRYTTDARSELERSVSYEETAAAMKQGIEDALGIHLEYWELTPEQDERARELEAEYALFRLQRDTACISGGDRIENE